MREAKKSMPFGMLSILPSALSINLLWCTKLHREEPTDRLGGDTTNHPFDKD